MAGAVARRLNPVEKSVLLLLRAARERPIPGRLFLQKEIYALQRGNRELATHLAFEPHLMGPHSDVLEGETEQLELSGLVDSAQGLYSLTPLGEEVAKNVAKTVPIQEIELVEQTKELLNDLHRDELLALVYFGMVPPEYKDESEEYERIRRNRIPLALRLLKKEKISAGKAAEIAGVSVDELIARFDQLPA